MKMFSLRASVSLFIFSVIFSLAECQTNDPRIVNGFTVTSMDGFKHQVSIRSITHDQVRFGNGHMCGGSLISPNVVLTAAHCVYNDINRVYYDASNFVVAMGGLGRFNRDANTLYITAAKVVGHAGFNINTFANDIAVIILSQNVSSNHPTVQPITLAPVTAAAGTTCQISGWGTLTYEGIQPEFLQAASVTINSRAQCNLPNRYNGQVLNGMFCAGLFTGSVIQDSCQGDSGGPLTCNGVLVGITSNGVECARQNYPGVYVDVNSYLNWIDNSLANSTGLAPIIAPIVATTSSPSTSDSFSAVANILIIMSSVLLSSFYK